MDANSPSKICVIGVTFPAYGDCHHSAFIFDPLEEIMDHGDGDDVFIPRHPTLRFEGLDLVGFCVFRSVLYIFDPIDFTGRKSVHSFDLSTFYTETSQTTTVVRKSMLKREADMVGPKHTANAVVTPSGGEILVFSGRTVAAPIDERVDFELYDPVGKKSTPLPPLPQWKDSSNFQILTSGFISERVFVILTDEERALALDLDLQVWQDYKAAVPSSLACHPRRRNPSLLVGNEFCVTYSSVVRQLDGATMCPIPPPKQLPPPIFVLEHPDMWAVIVSCIGSLLMVMEEEEEKNRFSFCFVQAASDMYKTGQTYITCDAWQTDRGGEGITTTKLNSFGFLFHSEMLSEFLIVGIYH